MQARIAFEWERLTMALAKLFSSSLASMHITVVMCVITLQPRKCQLMDAATVLPAVGLLPQLLSVPRTPPCLKCLLGWCICLHCRACLEQEWSGRQEAQREQA